jgi:phosphoenolpyruvate synthase/pyruvate phosphate dikinase
MSALAKPTHEQLDQKKKKKKKKRQLIQMTKSQGKAKTGSFKISKTWSSKTWATTRRNQVKHN